jgi:acetyl-CoA synthetase
VYCAAQATVVITADQLVRGGRVIGLKQTVDEALRVCPTVSHVLVHSLTGASVDMKRGRDIRLEEVCLC